jgi:hypothetical protein
MPGAVTNPPFGVQDPLGARPLAAISPNTRVRGSNGTIATQADAVMFPGAWPTSVTCMWTIPNARVSISGVRVITATSQGLALTTPPGPPTIGPVIVAISDLRISIL